MSMRYPGGLLTAATPVNAQYPSGVWTQAQTIPYVQQNVWQRDVYWPYTTLLLHGDGTNGAQNNTFLDSSTNNFTITRNGNTTQGSFTPFQQDGYWSNYFDGSGDYLSVPNNTDLILGTGDCTIECWVYPLAVNASNANPILNKLNGSSNNGWLLGMSSTSQWQFSTGSNVIVRAGTVVLNTWTHLAAVRASGTTTLYVNGVSVGTTASAFNFTDTVDLLVGFNSSFVAVNAYVSNVRLVKGTAVYTSNFIPSNTPLTAITNTSLLTCQSNRFKDNSTNAFAITVNGNTAVQAFQPFPGFTTWSASVLVGSGYFDGSGDYLATPTSGQFTAAGDFTVSCWFMLQSFSSSYYVVAGNWSAGTSDEWLIQIQNNGAIRFLTAEDGTFSSTGVVRLNEWTFFSASRSGSTVTVQVNGTTVRTYTKSGTFGSASKSINIGQQPGNNWPFNGYITALRLVSGSAITGVPTTPPTAISGTGLLLNFTNAGIFDNAQMNNLETVGNAQVSTSVVKYGTGSMYFDGSGDWLAGPPTPQTDLGSGDFTLEAWLYRTASGAAFDSGIVSRGAPSTSNGFVFAYTSSNVLTFNFNYSGAIVTGVTVIPANTWTHVAVSRNGNTFRLFVNGVLDATATSTNSQTTNASDIFYVGRSGYDSGRIMTGYIDDLRITKGAARYITNFTPPIARMPNQ